MFSFFRKLKPSTASDTDSEGRSERGGSSPITPARKIKSNSKERDPSTKKTSESTSNTGTRKKDVVTPVTPAVVSAAATGTMGNVADVDQKPTPSSGTGVPNKEEGEVKGGEESWAVVNRRNFLMSPAVITDVIKTQIEEETQCSMKDELKTSELNDVAASESTQKVEVLEKQVEELEHEKRNLVNQEARFQEQLAELTAQIEKRDLESNKLRYQMEDLQRDVLIKSSGVDRLQAELEAAHKESECVRRRLRQLEEDLTTFKQKNSELQEELEKKSEEMQSTESTENEKVLELEKKLEEMSEKVKQLEEQLNEVRAERDKLEQERAEMIAEREEEMKIVQEALEEAQEEKAAIQARFEQDFEKLRTVNTDREQQLLDDFEWKLREVEQACKKRLEDKEKSVEERVREGRKELEAKLKLAEQQLKDLPQLKSYEAEVVQLRGLSLEQQRSLRVTTRQAEQLQVSERMLKEEINRLKELLDKEKSSMVCTKSLYEKKLVDNEKRFQSRLEQQKNDITAQWEDRLQRECSRLKSELDQLHTEEKQLAVESAKVQKDQELSTAKQSWEKRVQEYLKEPGFPGSGRTANRFRKRSTFQQYVPKKQISALKDRLTEKDTYYHNELERAQTNADRDIFDLRRKLDKIDVQYQEQIEKLVAKHEQEIERLNEESERKIQQLEQNWQLQMSSTRATLELVKEQMERDAQDKLEAAEQKHRNQLELQWEQLEESKAEALLEMEKRYREELELVKSEYERKNNFKENELLETIANLRKQLQGQTVVINDLQSNVDLLQGGMQVLNQEISNQNHEIQRVTTQTATKLREREMQLEAEQNKKLAELKDHHETEIKKWQHKLKTVQDQLQQKITCLSKLLEEAEKNQQCNQHADSKLTADLQQALEERENEVACLTQEKRYYQMELMNCEKVLQDTEPEVLQHRHGPRKKNRPDSTKTMSVPPHPNNQNTLKSRAKSVHVFPNNNKQQQKHSNRKVNKKMELKNSKSVEQSSLNSPLPIKDSEPMFNCIEDISLIDNEIESRSRADAVQMAITVDPSITILVQNIENVETPTALPCLNDIFQDKLNRSQSVDLLDHTNCNSYESRSKSFDHLSSKELMVCQDCILQAMKQSTQPVLENKSNTVKFREKFPNFELRSQSVDSSIPQNNPVSLPDSSSISTPSLFDKCSVP